MLRLVPKSECEHLWIEAAEQNETVIAVCNGCKKRGIFTHEEFTALLNAKQAVGKPMRI